MSNEVRVDKWLWAVRLYKTRTLASEECRRNRITINGAFAKPSRTVKVGDKVGLFKPPVNYSYEVKALAEKRMGAKLVPDFLKDITAPDQKEVLEMHKLSFALGRNKGTGRPTKKDRRDIDRLMDWDDDDNDLLD